MTIGNKKRLNYLLRRLLIILLQDYLYLNYS